MISSMIIGTFLGLKTLKVFLSPCCVNGGSHWAGSLVLVAYYECACKMYNDHCRFVTLVQ